MLPPPGVPTTGPDSSAPHTPLIVVPSLCTGIQYLLHIFASSLFFMLNATKIELYKSGIDPTKEVGDEEIKKTKIHFTKIKQCEISDVTENSAVIKVPIYDENEIINKNKYIIIIDIDCIEKYGRTKIEYSKSKNKN